MLTRKSLTKYIDRPGVIYNDKKHVNCSTRKRISVNYWISKILTKLGIINVINLINGKIRSENKLNQIKKNILSNPEYNLVKNFDKTNDNDLNNHWLAGFSDAYASFQINLINKNINVRLNFQIEQKQKELLILIKNFLGGNIGYRKTQNTYYYESTSAKKVINYFDKFHLLSSKQVNYLKWRKSYIIIQNKEHLTNSGVIKIIRLKNLMKY